MSTWLILVVTIIYICIAISFVFEDKIAMAIIWGGYSVANIGFIVAGISNL